MKRLAVIAARGGSKRIPGKNLREFHGIPVIGYSIRAALDSGCFEEVMVSTDDTKTAAVAVGQGAKVPFLRSDSASSDVAGLSEVVREVIDAYRSRGMDFDYFCCILATSPFVTAKRLAEAWDILHLREVESVFPVVRFSYPIQRSLRLRGNLAEMFWPEYYVARSQDLEPAYHDCGQFYWARTQAFMVQNRLFMSRSAAIVVPEMEAQDIDVEEDWRLAEMKYALLHG